MILTVHLTRDRKLPNRIECSECGAEMRRYFGGGVYKVPVYRCRNRECGALTTLYPDKAQKARGIV